MAKSLGITGSILVNGTDYECNAGNVKLEQEKIEIVAIGGNGWAEMLPGGVKKLTGSISFPFDAAHATPFADTLVPVVFNIDASHSITFQAVISDMDIKKTNKGVTEVTANFESSGVVTYA